MSWLEAAIGVVGSLFEGNSKQKAAQAASRQERKWALEDQAEQFVRLRAAAEKGGFNPLTALGAAPNSGMVNPTSAARGDFMGTAIAESALMLADGYAKTRAAAQGRTVEDLRRQRDILSRKLRDQTIRPTVPGIYGNGGGNAVNSGASFRALSSDSVGVSRSGDAISPAEKHLITSIHSSGASSDIPTPGSDPDEALFGWVIDQWNRAKADRRFENSDEARAGAAQRFRPPVMGWPSGAQRYRPGYRGERSMWQVMQPILPPGLWGWQ